MGLMWSSHNDCQAAEELRMYTFFRWPGDKYQAISFSGWKNVNTFIKHFIIFIIGIGILSVALLLPGSAQPTYANSTASLTVNKTVVPEGDDFATRVLGLPWNLNTNPYPDYFTALKGVDQNKFKITNDGFWELTTTDNDAHFWLNWSGIEDTQRVLRMGDTRPIDANKYKLLSYYMCLGKAPVKGGANDHWAANVYWMYDRRPHVNPNNGWTKYLFFILHGRFKNDGDCELITMDLSKSALWDRGQWNNSPNKPQGFRLDFLNIPGANVKLGWVRLTTVDTSNSVPLKWSNAPAGRLDFYASRDGCNVKGIHIGYVENASASGTFNWGAQLQPGFSDAYPLPIPESFEPGQYHIYMRDSAGKISCGNNKLTVHQAPILEFQKPSFYSGPDYASTQVRDPWGMSNANDIARYRGITTPTFSNGIMSATSKNNDPTLIFNVKTPIDTSVYKYVTLRMRINAPNKEGDDLVQRFLWWTKGEGIDQTVTEDMEIYEGWHTYSIDLTQALTEGCGFNCWFGKPTGFRMDPHESWTKHSFDIDFMTITGIDTVVRGDPASIKYTVNNAPNAKVTFYYDNDRDPNNGRTVLASYNPNNASLSGLGFSYQVMVPFVKQFGEIDFFPNSLNFNWDTSGTAANTYYICADVDDGVMTTTWYSEVPVIIK